MIMGIWRDLTALVLLAHLVTLARGSLEGKGAFEELLARNVSIVVIEDKADGPVDLEKLINATSLAPVKNNITVDSNTTKVVDENELVVELEEALVSAASSGQVIMIAPPANRANSTNSLPGPVIVIETPANNSKSLVKEAVSQKNKKRKTTGPRLDQEIAQSQTKQRAGPQDYEDDEDLENLEDLLAITEYEPQRIDAKRIDEKIPKAAGGELNSTKLSTGPPLPEETHYDVPKQRNPPRNYRRTSDDYRPTSLSSGLNETSNEGTQKSVTLYLHPSQTNRKTTTFNRIADQVDRPTAPTTSDQKPRPSYTEITGGPKNSEIIIPLTTKASAPRKLNYNEVTRRNNLLGAPTSIDATSTFGPGLPGSSEARLKLIQNVTNISNQPRRNLHSARVQTTPVSLPSTYYPFLQHQGSSVSAKISSQSTLPTSAVPRASRRIDDYSSTDYETSSKEELQPLTNQQLGYLTRYNQPSLFSRQVPNTRVYPASSEYKQAEASKESLDEKQSDEEDSSENTSPRSSRIAVPVHDSYDNGRRLSSNTRTTSRPPFVDYKKLYQKDNQQQQPIVDYEKVHQKENQRQQPIVDYEKVHQKDNQRQQPIVDYEKVHQKDNQRQQPIVDYQKVNERGNQRQQHIDDYQKVNERGNQRQQPIVDYQETYQGDNARQRPVVDYQKTYQGDKPRQQPVHDYQKTYQRDNPRQQPAADYQKSHQRDIPRQQLVADYKKSHQRDDPRQQAVVGYQKTHQRDDRPQHATVDYRNDRGASIAKTTPAYESYEEDEEESPASEKSEEVTSTKAVNKIYPRNQNQLVPSTTTPVYDSYEDEVSEKPQQQRFVATEQQRQRVTTSPYVLPSKQLYQPYNYFGRTLQPVTPTSLVDNPIYQLHGVKTTNPGPVAANAIYNNPAKNYQERRPSTASAPLERQSTRYVPRGTATSQRIVSTTAASDSYEDSEESESPPVTTQRLRNPNYVDHQNAKPLYSVFTNNRNLVEVTTLAPSLKQNTEYAYDEPVSNRYSLYQTKPIKQLPPHTPFNPERNSNFVAARITTPAYVENSGSNEDESNDERSYVPAATKLQALNRRNNLERGNPVIRSTARPEYESYEDGDEEDNVSPSGSVKLIESNTANYGSRVRPRVVAEEERHFVPSYTHAALTTPVRSRNVKTNYGGRRRASLQVEEEPVASVQRADVEEAPYEDEVPASSGHAEDQATHQTHAKAKKHGGGGGGDHKHEEGGGMKHDEDHHESHGKKGDKGYKGYHEYDKGKKGHHDKEGHDKEYDEKKGEKKKHHDEGSYHKEHHHGEKGDKEAEFAEKGEHQKGHSTKGQHVVHKKDEYEKKTEFYDESHEEDGDEKEGEYHHEHEHKKGGHEKKGHHDSAHHQDKYGEKGEHEKGHHYHEKKGHDGKDGKDQHHEHHEKYGKKGGHEEGLKWTHKKGDDGHGGGKKKGS